VALIAAAKGSQILSNPGFESGSLSPWFIGYNGGGTTWSITSTNCNSGGYCAVDNGDIELEQTFAPVPVASITDINFWALHPDPDVTALAVDLLYQGGAVDEFILYTSGTGWNFFDVFSDLETSGSLIGIGIYGNTQGVTMLDDASITSGAPEPATAAFLLVGLGVLAVARYARFSSNHSSNSR
jgi:hypothetical protein